MCVKNSNHYGIAGYYARMIAREHLLGVSMTNTEAIMIPTNGRQALLGTNPIAVGMPAEPYPFLFDAATTVVPRGKVEVYAKKGLEIPADWAMDSEGKTSTLPRRVLDDIGKKQGGGILPLGGAREQFGSHKGYGFGMIVEIMTGYFGGRRDERRNPQAVRLRPVQPLFPGGRLRDVRRPGGDRTPPFRLPE